MLSAIVISNHIEGLDKYYVSNPMISYDIFPVSINFNPPLAKYDVLIVPNGSDHIAMIKIKTQVRHFLNQGKALICCDGWFTDWIPGNRWYIDNFKKSIDIRYFVKDDPRGFFAGLDINQFIFSHGISGFWACGYISPCQRAHVLLEDTWSRPIVVMDEVSTKGTILMTASGPLADMRYDTDSVVEEKNAMGSLYHRWISYLLNKKNKQNA